jgi:hypothetical protein
VLPSSQSKQNPARLDARTASQYFLHRPDGVFQQNVEQIIWNFVAPKPEVRHTDSIFKSPSVFAIFNCAELVFLIFT